MQGLDFLMLAAAPIALMTNYIALKKEQAEEKEAFRRLRDDLPTMSKVEVWKAALSLGRKRRALLNKENFEARYVIENMAKLHELSEGLRKCRIMLVDPKVPDEVKRPIFEHWVSKYMDLFRDYEGDVLLELYGSAEASMERMKELRNR